MRPKASDGNDGGAAKSGPTPIRAQIMETMLQVAGEHGYRNTTVRRVLEHRGGSRAQFYKHFSSAAACYAEAYALESEHLCELLLAAGRQEDWRAGLEAALGALAKFANERPAVARGLLIEVHVAGEPSLRKRQEVLERLSRAVDSARRETRSRHSPPPLTAMFIVQLVDAAMVNALGRGAPERFPLAELAKLAAVYYDLVPGDDSAAS